MLDSCKKYFVEPDCLLRQLAESADGKTESAKCQHCDVTVDQLGFSSGVAQQLAAGGEGGEGGYASESACQRVRQFNRGLLQETKGIATTQCLNTPCPNCGTSIPPGQNASATSFECPECGQVFQLLDAASTDFIQRPRDLGRFQLMEIVGSGSFGVVWRAKDNELDRTVAIKIPRRERLSEKEIGKFLNEARATAQLSHPNIVSVHEIGRQHDTLYIVSDFIHGQTLDEFLQGRILPPRAAAKFCATLADALQHAHQHGIVHRDLKPGNIGIDHAEQLHIMDFGLALRSTVEATLTADGQILGTPAYMSPEQARGDSHQADQRSDIYALGVILFEMLTGERPFRGNVRMLLYQITHDEPPHPQRLNSSIPRDLSTICLKCLEKSPDRRYQSAAAVQQELLRFLDHLPIQARPVSAAERAWRWCKRNPLPTALTSLLLLSLAAGTGVSSWKWMEASANAETARNERRQAQATAGSMQQQSAELLFERGQALCEAGDTTRGLNWMCQSLRTLPASTQGQAWARMVRANIAAWRADTPRLLYHWELPESVTASACSPTADLLVTGGMQGRIRRFELTTGTELGATEASEIYEDNFQVNAIDFHPSGKHFIAARGSFSGERIEGTLVEIDADTGLQTRQLLTMPGLATDACYSYDGRLIAVGIGSGPQATSPSNILIVDAESGNVVGDSIPVAEGLVWNLAFTPGGQAITCTVGEQLIQFDLESRQAESLKLSGPGTASTSSQLATRELDRTSSVAWHPSGQTLVTAMQDATTSIRRFPELTPTTESLQQNGAIQSVAFHPDGSSYVSASWSGIASIVDAVANERAHSLFFAKGRTSWNFNGDKLVAFNNRTVQVWNAPQASYRAVAPFKQPVKVDNFANFRASISSDMKTVAVSDTNGLARLFDSATGLTIGAPMQHPLYNVRATAISPDGKQLATACHNYETVLGYVRLWDTATGQPLTEWLPQTNWVTSLDFSADGKRLAMGDYAANAIVWDVESLISGEPKQEAKFSVQDIVLCTRISRDGSKVMVGTADSRTGTAAASLWSVANGSRIGEVMEHTDWVSFLTFSPQEDQALTLSPDGWMRLWNTQTAEPIGERISYSPSMGLAIYSDDGRYILSGGSSGTVKLWDSKTGALVEGQRNTLSWNDDAVSALAFSPDGSYFAVGLHSGRFQLCDTATFSMIGPATILRSKILALSFSEAGDRLIAAAETGVRDVPITRFDVASSGVPSSNDWDEIVAVVELDTGFRFDRNAQSTVPIPREEWLAARAAQETFQPSDARASAFRSTYRRLLEAVEDVDSYAIAYYLDQLEASEPPASLTSWPTWARLACRAHLLAINGEFEQAEQLYAASQEALDTAPLLETDAVSAGAKSGLTDWLRHRAADALRSESWRLSEWYLTQLIRQQAEDWTLYRDRAHVLLQLDEPERRESDIASALQLQPDSDFLTKIAEERGQQGDWEKCLELLERAHENGFQSIDGMERHLIAAASVDPERTRPLVKKMLEYTEETTLTLGLARYVILLSGLSRVDSQHGPPLLELSQEIIDLFPEEQRLPRAEALGEHGNLLIRLERYAEAIELLEESAKLRQLSNPKNLVCLAIAHAYNGDLDRAHEFNDQILRKEYRAELTDYWSQIMWDLYLNELDELLDLPASERAPVTGEETKQ